MTASPRSLPRPGPTPRWRIHPRPVVAVVASIGCALGVGVYAFARADPAMVSVFPAPGGRVASPQTQITFRGMPVGRLGKIVVTGSRSGAHTGQLRGDSDGRGGSFLPERPFVPGEVVTVRTGLRIGGVRKGTFRFKVAIPAGAVPMSSLGPAPRVSGDVMTFRSRPDLTPAAVEITKPTSQAAAGDVFLTPQQGPVQNGTMILAPDGTLVWFAPVPKGDMAADLRVQRYRGRPVLTWWQGYSGAGIGIGEDVIASSSYRQLAVVHAGNGLSADMHEFRLTRGGTALITAYYPVRWNLSSVGGPARGTVLDSVVQEIDIKTGLVLFQWDSLDHVPVTESYQPLPHSSGSPYDYFHVNSIQQQKDGELIISARNTWAAYRVSPDTGKVIWALGGKHSSFKLSRGASFAFQHDVRVRARDGREVTVFDDGAGPPAVHQQSRGLTLRLDGKHRRAIGIKTDQHSPPLLASFEGNIQSLPDGNEFLGWGQQPYFTEFNARGEVVFDGRFVDANSSYRAYRFRWTGTPDTKPSVAVSTSGQTTTVYASWNGATRVSSWRVLAGDTPGSLQAVGGAPKQGFETRLAALAAQYFAVQAIDADGRVLATSATVHAT